MLNQSQRENRERLRASNSQFFKKGGAFFKTFGRHHRVFPGPTFPSWQIGIDASKDVSFESSCVSVFCSPPIKKLPQRFSSRGNRGGSQDDLNASRSRGSLSRNCLNAFHRARGVHPPRQEIASTLFIAPFLLKGEEAIERSKACTSCICTLSVRCFCR